jgi:hypothetical protein
VYVCAWDATECLDDGGIEAGALCAVETAAHEPELTIATHP